ncbi:haloacid dehalogenase [Anaerocolumna cellulosilytica]|uniref:Haloacid dehalogenase n=1 Tax=Anaerocolumna cellulosilytica TaxID=433286 RepID=A0A6S6R684_9FIRM|nr:HAD family hydrolase [Anaerocolumna cellulosilytica]MBB5196497.1 phosphoglycolate phosphatase [Anaerocolumna cellulosilytica]BCJ95597.1 haloacid dehalogenase [Anaerocolumna cellulosilytica]
MTDSIIFDLDGTLWDATDGAAVIWTEVASKYPQVTDKITADKLKSLYGLVLEEIAVKLLPSASRETALAIMRESVIRQCPYLEEKGGILFNGLVETLTDLKKKYKLYIVSNCEEGYIQCFLKAHKLGEFFEDFEYPGRTGRLKAENIRMVMERNSLKNPVYVGDTNGDATAAKKAGIPFIYARYGFGEVAEYERSIDSIKELPALLI